MPLPFVVDQGTTYDTVGNKQVWGFTPSSGLDKRQATLQLCIRAEGDQNVKPALVFRGKGNISSAEKDSYDERVDVYFQQNAWIDAEVNMQWCRKTLFPGVGNTEQEKVILQTMSVSNNPKSSTKHAGMKLMLLYICCLRTTRIKSSPLMQGVDE